MDNRKTPLSKAYKKREDCYEIYIRATDAAIEAELARRKTYETYIEACKAYDKINNEDK